jgi:ubiquinone/menaquinone biosynthesis C-methylase UbiE
MLANTERAVRLQRQYYAETAAEYDAMHAREGDDNPRNLRWVRALIRMVDARSVLDVGAGTGRGVRHLLDNMPGLLVRGIEPVAERIQQAVQMKGIPKGVILQGVGEALPFEDASIDVVCCFGMLHHVPKPNSVVREMLRVARKAVVIVDGNRFGQGSWPLRLLKFALYKAGLWGFVNYLKTAGKGYTWTEGDGVLFSYSVYDSLDCLADWANELIVFSADPSMSASRFQPLFTASSVFVGALKKID